MKKNHKSELSWVDAFVEMAIENESDLAIDIGANVAEARIKAGITQVELAKRMETLQPSIARIESGAALPSLVFLLRVAKALRTHIVAPTFESIRREPKEEPRTAGSTHTLPTVPAYYSNAIYRNILISSPSASKLIPQYA